MFQLSIALNVALVSLFILFHRTMILEEVNVPFLLCHRGDLELVVSQSSSDGIKESNIVEWWITLLRN